MVSPRTSRETNESPCPACGHAIKSQTGGRNRRVQCPKCREVVDLADEAAPKEAPLLDRMQKLEARVGALEAALHQAANPPPAEDPPPLPAQKMRWVSLSSAADFQERFSPEMEDALLHNLKTRPPHAITIQSATGDPAARRRAERLKAIFQRARWDVSGPRDVATRVDEHGLSLTVGSLPPSHDVAAIHLALTASGFALRSLLDPNLSGDDALLVVA